ncbi:hypothetical protein N7486_006801 [Penicillium sp. IBT 16267x]|nr:hypothetical protein N7486_006801 [Penicillium sp. IBT 16267x]
MGIAGMLPNSRDTILAFKTEVKEIKSSGSPSRVYYGGGVSLGGLRRSDRTVLTVSVLVITLSGRYAADL